MHLSWAGTQDHLNTCIRNILASLFSSKRYLCDSFHISRSSYVDFFVQHRFQSDYGGQKLHVICLFIYKKKRERCISVNLTKQERVEFHDTFISLWLQLPNPHNASIGQLQTIQSTLNKYSAITICQFSRRKSDFCSDCFLLSGILTRDRSMKTVKTAVFVLESREIQNLHLKMRKENL